MVRRVVQATADLSGAALVMKKLIDLGTWIVAIAAFLAVLVVIAALVHY